MIAPRSVCILIALTATTLLHGCDAARRNSSSDVPKLAGDEYGYDIQAFRGQVVRVCGRLAQRYEHVAVEHIPQPGETFHHGYPAVLVIPCGQAAPRLDRDGCLTGRVAAQDGSMSPPQRQIRSNAPYSPDWLLHAQCPALR